MDTEIRKYRDYLKISGRAVLTFGIWGALRVFILRSGERTIFELFAEQLADMTGVGAEVFEALMILFYIILDMIFRVYIWRAAVAEGNGRKKRSAYLFVAGFYIVLSFVCYVIYFIGGPLKGTILDYISIVLVDITTLVALFIIIYASVKLKRIEKMQESIGENNAG